MESIPTDDPSKELIPVCTIHPPPDPPIPTRIPQAKILLCIPIHAAFSTTNFVFFLLATTLTITLFVFLNASTTFVLSQVLRLSDNLGTITGSLAFYDELVSMAMVVVWGSVSDFSGRRIIYTTGFLLMGAALLVYPYTRNVYPELLLARFLFAIGGTACSTMLTAVLADCCYGGNPGKITGIVGLCSGLGALIAVFLFLPLPTSFQSSLALGVQYTYLIVGSISIVFACLFFFFASNLISYRPTDGPALESSTSKFSVPKLLAQAKLGIFAMRDLRILSAYAAGFCARGNTAIITIFIPLWINQYYIINNLCAVPGLDPNDENAVKESCRAAFTQSSIIGGVTQTFALVGAPVWGVIIHKYGVERKYSTFPLMMTCVIASAGYLLLFYVENPLLASMYPIIFLVGVGEIGTVITSAAMVASGHIDPVIRGSVAGAYSLFGGLGILLCTRVGGYLFDAWTFTAPFFLMFLIHCIAASISLLVIVVEWRGGS